MLNRLSTQLFLMTIAVAVVAALVSGLLVRNRTVSAFETAVERDLSTDSSIYDEITTLPYQHDSWVAAEEDVIDISQRTGERIAITELDGSTVIVDTDPGSPLPAAPATVLFFDDFGVFYDDAAIDRCLIDLGLELDGDDGLLITEPVSDQLDGQIDQCILANQIDPTANALLFLGYDTEPVNLGSIGLDSLLLGGGAVLAIAAVGAVLLARRVSGPVEQLTEAATQLRSGDLSQRVDAHGNGEVAALGASFNSMANRLEETEQSRQRLISDVAHELRNPIGVLQGSLEAAQDGVLPLDDQLVGSMVSETQHLAQLVRDLQEVNLAEHDGLRIERLPTDLAEICAEVVSSYSALNPDVSLTSAGNSVPIQADPLRIRQVVENLVKNALAHTNAGGSVTVSVAFDPHAAHVTVADTGTGIAPHDLDHVFDRFWRADASRTRETGGSGLGLSICKAIVDAHGGSLSAVSTPGEGTTFVFSLPRSPNTG